MSESRAIYKRSIVIDAVITFSRRNVNINGITINGRRSRLCWSIYRQIWKGLNFCFAVGLCNFSGVFCYTARLLWAAEENHCRIISFCDKFMAIAVMLHFWSMDMPTLAWVIGHCGITFEGNV